MKQETAPTGWMSLGIDAVSLGVDTAAVIGLRMATFSAGGPRAFHEATRMISEKFEAVAYLQMELVTGGLGANPATIAHRTLRYCSKKVKANRRRLG